VRGDEDPMVGPPTATRRGAPHHRAERARRPMARAVCGGGIHRPDGPSMPARKGCMSGSWMIRVGLIGGGADEGGPVRRPTPVGLAGERVVPHGHREANRARDHRSGRLDFIPQTPQRDGSAERERFGRHCKGREDGATVCLAAMCLALFLPFSHLIMTRKFLMFSCKLLPENWLRRHRFWKRDKRIADALVREPTRFLHHLAVKSLLYARRSEQRIANPLFPGSNPGGASRRLPPLQTASLRQTPT
jgi:hypothetical protein